MIALDLLEDHVRRPGLVDFLRGLGESVLFLFQFSQTKLE